MQAKLSLQKAELSEEIKKGFGWGGPILKKN